MKRDQGYEWGCQQAAGSPIELTMLAAQRANAIGDHITPEAERGKPLATELAEELADATMYLMFRKQLLAASGQTKSREYGRLTAAHRLIAQAANTLGYFTDDSEI